LGYSGKKSITFLAENRQYSNIVMNHMACNPGREMKRKDDY
jgi:hypothetical protein